MTASDGRSSESEKLIVADRLTRRYGSVAAADDVSFDVHAGEVVGLLGPNGAGKSTVMRVLAGYLPPTRGKAFVAGRDVVADSLNARRAMGYLPEQFALYGDMRVYDYLKYRARLKGLNGRKCRNRVVEMLNVCDLENVAEGFIGALSRGYRQRVGLADAMIHDPPVLILDEPGLGLDPNQLRQLRRILTELSGRHAVLLSSHGLPEIERVCGRVLIMHQGRIVAAGTPAGLVGEWRGCARFVAEASGNTSALLQACRRMRGVDQTVVRSNARWCRLEIKADRDVDLGPEIFRMAVQTGCVLRELRRERETLDDVFAALTAPPAGGGAI